MKVVHPGHPPKPLILRCEPKASLEGRNPADTAPFRRCVLRGSRLTLLAPQHEEVCDGPFIRRLAGMNDLPGSDG